MNSELKVTNWSFKGLELTFEAKIPTRLSYLRHFKVISLGFGGLAFFAREGSDFGNHP